MLLNWSGQLTGIQRVEYNLAKRFAAMENVSFCIFDKVSQKCIEYDFKHIEYKVSQLQIQKDTLGTTTISEADIPKSYPKLLKKAYRFTVRVAPRHATALVGRTYRKVRTGSNVRSQEKQAAFQNGDVFLILSGDWSDSIFAKWVSSLRSSQDIRIIQVVYDMLPYVQPAYFVEGMTEQFTRYMKKIFKSCDAILAISRSTKKDVQRFMNDSKIQEVPTKVFRLGDDFVKQIDTKPNVNVNKGEFLLCVGTIEARKNHLLLYYAVREAIDRGISTQPIVVVGKVGWLAKDFINLVTRDPQVSQKFIFLNHCTDQELGWLFRNCNFTVYPSYYEGWGLPIAESLYYGKYCLASNSSSMPEIAGELIDYFSPNDPIKLLELITRYTDNPELLKAKEELIARKYQATSWDETFDEVSQFVNSIQPTE